MQELQKKLLKDGDCKKIFKSVFQNISIAYPQNKKHKLS